VLRGDVEHLVDAGRLGARWCSVVCTPHSCVCVCVCAAASYRWKMGGRAGRWGCSAPDCTGPYLLRKVLLPRGAERKRRQRWVRGHRLLSHGCYGAKPDLPEQAPTSASGCEGGGRHSRHSHALAAHRHTPHGQHRKDKCGSTHIRKHPFLQGGVQPDLFLGHDATLPWGLGKRERRRGGPAVRQWVHTRRLPVVNHAQCRPKTDRSAHSAPRHRYRPPPPRTMQPHGEPRSGGANAGQRRRTGEGGAQPTPQPNADRWRPHIRAQGLLAHAGQLRDVGGWPRGLPQLLQVAVAVPAPSARWPPRATRHTSTKGPPHTTWVG
jgi:hypothetical protein